MIDSRTFESLVDALNIAEHRKHMDEIMPFAYDFARRAGANESELPNPQAIAAGAALFLGLRMAWNAKTPEIAAISESLPAIQDAFAVFDYHLCLNAFEFGLHTPENCEGKLSNKQLEILERAEFEADFMLGMLDAAVWHAIVSQVTAGRLKMRTPGGFQKLHRKYRNNTINRIGSGTFSFADQGMTGLILLASEVADDAQKVPNPNAMIEISESLRETLNLWNQVPNFAEYTVLRKSLATSKDYSANTLEAINGDGETSCFDYLSSMIEGSCTGLPHSENIAAIDNMIEELFWKDTQDASEMCPNKEVISGGVTFILAAMTITGRIPEMKRHRTKAVIEMVTENLIQNIQASSYVDEALLESIYRMILFNAYAVESSPEARSASDVDLDFEIVRTCMNDIDPTVPPSGESEINPRSLYVRASKAFDIEIVERHIEMFLRPQRDALQMANMGEIYWRLSDTEKNSYSGTIGALQTIASLPGIDEAGIIYRQEASLGVTTIRQGSEPVHRKIFSS